MLGRRDWRSRLSDQCAESASSESMDLREASFDRRTCHLDVKDVIESVEGRRPVKSCVILSRVSAGGSFGGGGVGFVVGGYIFAFRLFLCANLAAFFFPSLFRDV